MGSFNLTLGLSFCELKNLWRLPAFDKCIISVKAELVFFHTFSLSLIFCEVGSPTYLLYNSTGTSKLPDSHCIRYVSSICGYGIKSCSAISFTFNPEKLVFCCVIAVIYLEDFGGLCYYSREYFRCSTGVFLGAVNPYMCFEVEACTTLSFKNILNFFCLSETPELVTFRDTAWTLMSRA